LARVLPLETDKPEQSMTLSKRLLPILAAFALLLGCALAACNPIAIGRDGLQVGTPIDDPFILGPRPAIECAAISQESVIIGYILSQARSIVTSRDPNIIYLADEDQNFIMKLQFLD